MPVFSILFSVASFQCHGENTSGSIQETPEQDPTMILIEITNLDDLIKEHRGPLSALLGKLVTDVEGQAEKIIITELKAEFEKRGVKANIASIGGVSIRRFDSM